MSILTLILIIPFVCGVVMFFMPLNFKLLQKTHMVLSGVVSALLLAGVSKVINSGAFYEYNQFFFLDSLGAIFLSLVAIFFL